MATSSSTEDTSDIVRVILWCVPRSTSTAFLTCMTHVPNSQMWYEPYIVCYQFQRHGKELIEYNGQIWGTKADDYTSGSGNKVNENYYDYISCFFTLNRGASILFG